MGQPTTSIYLNSQTPAAPAGYLNGKFSSDGATPMQSVTVAVPSTGEVNEQTGNYTLQTSDCGKLVVINSANAVTVTLPTSVPFAQWNCQVASIGVGAVTIAPGGSLDLDGSTGSITLAQWQSCYIASDGTNFFSGRGIGGGGGASSGVASLNGLTGAVSIEAGTGISLSASGSSVEISATSGGGGSGASMQFGTGNPSGVYTPTFVQSKAATAVSVATATNVTSGNLLVVVASWEATLGTATCSDTLGTTYTRIINQASAGNNTVVVFVGIAPSSGACTATIAGGSSAYAITSIHEFSGCTTTVDISTSAAGNNGSSSQPSPLSLITTVGGDLILLAIYGNHSSTNYSAGTGYSLSTIANGSDAQAVEYAVQAAAGNVNGNFSATDNDDYSMAMIALKATSTTPVAGTEGELYFDTSASPWAGWVYHSGAWMRFQ